MASTIGWSPTTPLSVVADAVGFLEIALKRLEQAGMRASAELVEEALVTTRRDFETLWDS